VVVAVHIDLFWGAATQLASRSSMSVILYVDH
jgi:hypothetical protein